MMRSLTPISIVALAGAFGLAMVASAGASADSVSDFYKGKRVTLIVGSSPGGGYDAYARTTARHMGAHIPGHPDIIVKNNPGAGSVVAANRIYNVLPQDGTIIGAIQRTVPFNQIMGFKGPNYDPVKFQWLGSMTNEAGVIAVTDKAKAKTIEDTFKYKTIMGSTGPTDSEIYPALMNNTLGTKFTIVQGYPGSAEIHLALKRGEVEGYSQSWSSFRNEAGPKFLKNHVRVLVQLSLKPLAEMSKMGVPMIMDYVDKQHVLPQYSVDEVKTWWRLMLTSKAMGRPYTVGPKVPADRVKALRKAFMDTANDPAFVKDAKKQGREVSPISGEEVQQMVADLAAAPKATVMKVKDLIKYKGPRKTVTIAMVKNTGKVTKIKKGGRRIYIHYKGKTVKAKVSGSRTKLTVNGKKAKRKAVKIGMTCTFTYPSPGSEAKRVDCKK